MKKIIMILVLACVLSCLLAGCNKSAMPTNSSGEYWTTYSNIPGPPDTFKELNVKGPFYINRVNIGERSTAELLATVNFTKDQTFGTDTEEKYNTKFWVEKIQNAEGQTVSVKVSSNAANDFYVTLEFNTAEDDMPAYSAQCISDDGVHSAGGSVIPNSYEDPELPITGFKELNFKCKYEDGVKIKESLEEAGYDTFSTRYGDKTYTLGTYKELDSRAKIQETVLKPKDWNEDKNKSKGNVGFYSKAGDFTGSIHIDWVLNNIPFRIEINDARLEKLEDGQDQISYTMSGTAEMKTTSFNIEEMVFRLKDNKKKHFSDEYGFVVIKDPTPAVKWNYVETWEYVNDKYGTTFLLTVSYTTGDSATDPSGVPVKELDEIDGTDTMSFMMPAFGGSATWTFKKEK